MDVHTYMSKSIHNKLLYYSEKLLVIVDIIFLAPA